jgi:hypothetical protein
LALYIAIPNASHAVTEVATGTAIKTHIQIATPSTTDLKVLGWGVSFDGTSATGAPGVVTLIDTNVAATVTSLTPAAWDNDRAPASLCVGGTSATGFNASAEGTITASRLLDGQNIHPQTGYSVWFPEDYAPTVAPSRFLRLRCLFAASVNCIPWVVWREPA